ncbi:MAG: hypothetical protein ACKO7W_07150 [Elainella sp.]
MIIQNLEHLEVLNSAACSMPIQGGGRSLLLSLRNGILQLRLNGKDLLKTTLVDQPSDLQVSVQTGNGQSLYQISLIDGSIDSSIASVISSTSSGVSGWRFSHQGISAVASSSISVSSNG